MGFSGRIQFGRVNLGVFSTYRFASLAIISDINKNVTDVHFFVILGGPNRPVGFNCMCYQGRQMSRRRSSCAAHNIVARPPLEKKQVIKVTLTSCSKKLDPQCSAVEFLQYGVGYQKKITKGTTDPRH